MLEKVAKYHQDWIRIANSFLKNKSDAEDCVQDMYITLHKYKVRWEDIKYKNDDVNRYFIYMTLKNICLQFSAKKMPISELDNDNLKEIEVYDDHTDETLHKIDEVMQSWSWYDRTIFEIYMYTELSLRDLAYGSEKTPRHISADKKICDTSVLNGANISLSSIFNTIKRCKERLRAEITPNTIK